MSVHSPTIGDRLAAVLMGCILAVSDAAAAHAQAFRVLAVYNGKVETAHASFVAEANRWFPKMAAQHGFAYESTDDWSKLNRETLARYEVVVFFDARPDKPAQREAFRTYMEHGGGWMGFHFAGFALTPSEFPQNWDWYHNEFLGSGSYVSNTWRPTPAVLKVEDKTHPATQGLPVTFQSAPNEWYKWSKDLRTNADIKILLSIDPASFPLGTGPKPHEIWHSGYYPVAWTNVKYRMVYFNMGHNDINVDNVPGRHSSTFASDPQNKLILNALMWLGTRKAAPRPAPSADKPRTLSVLEYLRQISGRQTVAGIHNREPNSRPSTQSDRVARLTGRYPGLWSGDFLFSAGDVKNRDTMIGECKKQWEAGSIVQLMAHVAPPNQPEVCGWRGGIMSHLSDEQWRDLLAGGGGLNKVWKTRLDGFAVHLQLLKQSGVQVLFRPFHEMNQGRFWWGGRPGPQGTAALYRLTRDYLVGVKGLTNLVWVWDMQDLSRDFAQYDPGRDYWDIFAFDVYGDGYRKEWYDSILPIVGDKPMAIGECAALPTAKMLAEQPRWCFFMSWAELTFQRNGEQQIIDLYRSPRVITRERLPKFE
jgi:mannan endo-1,4-beta-mannosidase